MSLPKKSYVDAAFNSNESRSLLFVPEDQTARPQSCPASPRGKEYETAHAKTSAHHLQRWVPESSRLTPPNLPSVLVKVTPNDQGSSDVIASASRDVMPARDRQSRNYQIKSIRKGLPRIATDKADGRGSMKKRTGKVSVTMNTHYAESVTRVLVKIISPLIRIAFNNLCFLWFFTHI